MSFVFEWNAIEINKLLESCLRDESLPIIERNFLTGSSLLEAGCGLGRWVRFLSDRGYCMTGLEINEDAVRTVNKEWPDLEVIQGDCEATPFTDNQFDGVLSFGVVEHWKEGPQKPLREIFRILKPGGKAYITVPCNNTIRSFKRLFWLDVLLGAPKALARKLIKHQSIPISRLNKQYLYPVNPPLGDFFEYQMSPEAFCREVETAGFEVLEHLPLGLIDGIYHELNPFRLIVRFENWRFKYGLIAKMINWLFMRRPFTHAHMQAIIAVKRHGEETGLH